MAKNTFDERMLELTKEVNNLKDDVTSDVITQTALRLEKLNYSPPVCIPVAPFLRLTKTTLLAEIDKISAMSDQEACALAPDEPEKCQDLRIQFVTVLIYYYKKLMLLRVDNAEEWDDVDEMYVHD